METTKNPRTPIWFKILLVLSGTPILAYPFMLMMSAFLFDSPTAWYNILPWLIFIVIYLYPVALIMNIVYCNKKFHIRKRLSIILAVIPILLFGALLFALFN